MFWILKEIFQNTTFEVPAADFGSPFGGDFLAKYRAGFKPDTKEMEEEMDEVFKGLPSLREFSVDEQGLTLAVSLPEQYSLDLSSLSAEIVDSKLVISGKFNQANPKATKIPVKETPK